MQPKEPSDMNSMREIGQNFVDKGFFEINLSSGMIEWINEFALSKYGMTLEQVKMMTIYDLFPSEYRDSFVSAVSDESKGRVQRFSIWPGKTADGKLIWWYITKLKNENSKHWYRAEYISTTDKSGPDYVSMMAITNISNGYNDIATKLIEHQEWTRKEVAKVKNDIENIQDQIRGCLNAANRAANEAVEANQNITWIKNDMAEQFARQTTEILRLISTDSVHEERISAFEAHMQKAASEAATNAIRDIAASADKAGKALTTQAHKAGQGLARKVTVPVGAIATIATIIQWLINNWPRH